MNLKAVPQMLSLIPAVVTGPSQSHIEKVKAMTRTAFPSVKQLATQTLADWLAQPSHGILLVDVRAPKEFAVSHLKGALNLRTANEVKQAIAKHRPSKTVIYCSVGFRSSSVAARLKGVAAEVFNLEGSIFEWANEGRPVFRNEVEVSCVHPYNKRCAGMLKPGLASALK